MQQPLHDTPLPRGASSTLPLVTFRGYEPNAPVPYQGLVCMRCGIDGRIPGSANCVTRMTEQGELLVLCIQCYHELWQGTDLCKDPCHMPGFPSAAAVQTTFRVGRALGSAVGTVMGNVAALGVGATMGVASSVSQVAAQALNRPSGVMLPSFVSQPMIPLSDESTFHSPTAALPPPAADAKW